VIGYQGVLLQPGEDIDMTARRTLDNFSAIAHLDDTKDPPVYGNSDGHGLFAKLANLEEMVSDLKIRLKKLLTYGLRLKT
jgi:hypothetical protein